MHRDLAIPCVVRTARLAADDAILTSQASCLMQGPVLLVYEHVLQHGVDLLWLPANSVLPPCCHTAICSVAPGIMPTLYTSCQPRTRTYQPTWCMPPSHMPHIFPLHSLLIEVLDMYALLLPLLHLAVLWPSMLQLSIRLALRHRLPHEMLHAERCLSIPVLQLPDALHCFWRCNARLATFRYSRAVVDKLCQPHGSHVHGGASRWS